MHAVCPNEAGNVAGDPVAMTDKPDTTSMTGAEFQRHVGADPTEWAEAFLAVYDEAFLREGDDPLIDREERAGFTAAWFRDYGEACVAEAVRHTPWPSQQQPASQ